jgi:Poxvirus D5 protein-like.
MQGLLALAVEHAQRLYETGGQYHLPEGPTKRREMYEAAADPILRFALECLDEGDAGDKILKDDAYNAYAAMCNRDNDRAASEGVFKRNLPQQSVIDFENGYTRQLTPGDDRVACYKYTRFSEAGRELLSGRLRDRYFPGDTEVDEFDTGGDEEPGDADDEPDEEEQAAFGAKPIRDAAATRTGYVTVTGEVATTQRLGETDSGLKAVLTDVSGAIDFVSWDPDLNDHLEQLEGGYVAVRNAEVSEYDGRRQLTAVDGLTEITSIQSGVGFTEGGPGRESDDTPDEGAQGDLEETTEDNPITQTQGRIIEELRPSASNVTVSELAGSLGEDPNNVASALEQLAKKGRVILNGRAVSLNE